MFVWTDKVCIITGGCTGIGWAFLQNVLDKGAKCLITDLQYQDGDEKVQKLQKEYGQEKVVYFKVDLDSAFENCIQVFGRVDVLINCHGINQEINWPLKLQINLLESIKGCKLGLKYMGKNGYGGPASTNTGGVVMNVSSIEETTPIKPLFESTSNHGFGMVESAETIDENSPWKNQRPGGFADHGVKMIFVRIQWQHPLRMEIEATRKSSLGNQDDSDTALKRLNMWLKTKPRALKTDQVSKAGLEFIESEDTDIQYPRFLHIHTNYNDAFGN